MFFQESQAFEANLQEGVVIKQLARRKHSQWQQRIVICKQRFVPVPIVVAMRLILVVEPVGQPMQYADDLIVGRVAFKVMEQAEYGGGYASDGTELLKLR